LEAFDVGPRVLFFVDGFSDGSLHIVTEEVKKLWFPGAGNGQNVETILTNFYRRNAKESLRIVFLCEIK
jgi:hypothetical protein